MNPGRVRWLVAVLVLTLLCFRAATQTFSLDEVLSYIKIRDGGWSFMRAAGSVNSHLLNMVGMKLSLETFGSSTFALRIPALLAGFTYLALLLSLARRELGGGWLATLGFSVLATNPYILDFFCCARGYGLSLTFLLAGLLASSRLLLRQKSGLELLGLSLLFLAAYASSLTVAYSLLALNALVLAFQLKAVAAGDLRGMFQRVGLCLFLPQLIGVYLFTRPYKAILSNKNFYYGSETWAESIHRLLPLALAHVDREDQFDDPILPALDFLAPAIPFLLLGLLLSYALLLFCRDPKGREHRPLVLGLTTVAIAALSIGFHSLSHVCFGQPLPTARTALSLLLLVFMALVVLPFAIRTNTRIMSGLRGLTILPLVVILALQSRFLVTDYYAEWRWDAGAGRIFKELELHKREERGLKILALPFFHGPSLDFLREQHGARWIETIDQETKPKTRYDFIVVSARVAQIPDIQRQLGEVVFRDGLSEVWIVRPASE